MPLVIATKAPAGMPADLAAIAGDQDALIVNERCVISHSCVPWPSYTLRAIFEANSAHFSSEAMRSKSKQNWAKRSKIEAKIADGMKRRDEKYPTE